MNRILVVDDDDKFPFKLRDFFQLQGWEAVIARDGTEAMEKLQWEHFDGTLLDRRMPGATGDEVLKWIAAQPTLQHVCGVMLTGFASIPSAVESLKQGAWQFLVKGENTLADIKSVLSAGIAWKKCHLIRARLLTDFDRKRAFARLDEIVRNAVGADEFRILHVPAEGPVTDMADRPLVLRAR